MDVLVVGAGSMGRWLAGLLDTAMSRVEPDPTVTYYDEDTAVAEQAAAETDGRVVESFSDDDQYDVVGIAVPIPAVSSAITAHAPRARRAVVDVTGVMAEAVDALDTQTTDQEWASFHPLFAPENEPGNVPAVTGTSGPVLDGLWETLEDRGNTVFETTPEEHDKAMETAQARAHATLIAYGLTSESVPEEFQTTVSRRLDELVEQVASGDPRVYADIQETFDGADDLALAAEQLADADKAAFYSLYKSLSERYEPDSADTHHTGEDKT